MNDKLILQSMGLKLIDNRKKIRPYVIIEITGDLHDGDEVVEKTEFSLDDENLKKIMDILNKNHYYELFLTRHFFVMGWNEQKNVYKRLNGLNNKKIDEETLRDEMDSFKSTFTDILSIPRDPFSREICHSICSIDFYYVDEENRIFNLNFLNK